MEIYAVGLVGWSIALLTKWGGRMGRVKCPECGQRGICDLRRKRTFCHGICQICARIDCLGKESSGFGVSCTTCQQAWYALNETEWEE
jgi:hypothetical protein